MEEAYQKTLFQINEEIIKYVLSLIQDAELEVDDLRDFMKGYYVSKFSLLLMFIHMQNGNPPKDDEIIFQEYLKKISSSKKLKNILNQLL
ncbi:MAG: hypothetical protein ACRDFB_03010 [Rhabdochlamydiaceae bacterium]